LGDGASEQVVRSVPVSDVYQPVSGWQFPLGNSGPFGEDTEGPWRSFEQTAMTWLAYDMGLVGPDFVGGGKSHDIHCYLPDDRG
jgi:hypothetical protein